MELSHQENYVNHRQIGLKKAYCYDTAKFILPEAIEIKRLDVLYTNLKIDSNKVIKYLKNRARFVRRLPFRARRYFLKKLG
jgi:hypothetical protein